MTEPDDEPRERRDPLRRLVRVRVSATQLAVVLASSVAAAALVVGGTLAQGSPPDAVVAALARAEVVVHHVPGAAADTSATGDAGGAGDGSGSAGGTGGDSGAAGADAAADGTGAAGDGSEASGSSAAGAGDGSAAADTGDGSGSAESSDGSAAGDTGDGSSAGDTGDGSSTGDTGSDSGAGDSGDGSDTGDGSSGASGSGSGAAGATGSTTTPKPSKVKHVVVISLTSSGYDASFGAGSAATYLNQTLVPSGTLLTNYRLLDAADLPNALALVSGQPPNALTRKNCPTFTSYAPTARPSRDGSFTKPGCVYPVDTLTLADQVSSSGGSWRAYVEGTDPGKTCQHPAFDAADPTAADPSAADPTSAAPTATDPATGVPAATPPPAYATRHNPFVYFHSLLDLGDCATNDVGLDQLARDFAKAKTTPDLAYVVPDQCDRGVPGACPAGAPDGPGAADAFLRTWAPRILAAPGFRRDGLLVVTFDGDAQAPAGKPKVGTLLISPWTPKNKRSAKPADPYALLRTIEDLLGLAPLARAGATTTHPLDHTVIPHL